MARLRHYRLWKYTFLRLYYIDIKLSLCCRWWKPEHLMDLQSLATWKWSYLGVPEGQCISIRHSLVFEVQSCERHAGIKTIIVCLGSHPFGIRVGRGTASIRIANVQNVLIDRMSKDANDVRVKRKKQWKTGAVDAKVSIAAHAIPKMRTL